MEILVINFWGDSEKVGGKRWNQFGESLRKTNNNVVNRSYSTFLEPRIKILFMRLLRALGLTNVIFRSAFLQCKKDLCHDIERDKKWDLIIVTYPPIEMLTALKESSYLCYHIPKLVLDIRDGLTKELLEYGWEKKFIIRHHKSLLSWYLGYSNQVVFSNNKLQEIESDLQHVNTAVIYNGTKNNINIIKERIKSRTINIGYFGQLSGSSRGQNISELLKEIQEDDSTITLHLYGNYKHYELNSFKKYNFVKVHEFVPMTHVYNEMVKMDVLLLVATSSRKSILTGKIWDYLEVRKPILYHGIDDNAAINFLRENHIPFVQSIKDLREITDIEFNFPADLALDEQVKKLLNWL